QDPERQRWVAGGTQTSAFSLRPLAALAGNTLRTLRRQTSALLDQLACVLQLRRDDLLGGKGGAVLGREDLIRQALERIACDSLALVRAKDEAHRWVLAGRRPVLTGVVEVKVHLPGVRVRELVELEIDDDEAPKPPVEKEEVHAVPL